MVTQALQPYVDGVLDLLFPRICGVCEVALPTTHVGTICVTCQQDVEMIVPPLCACCGQALSDRPRYPRCVACPQGQIWFSTAHSAVLYRTPVVEMVHDFKFGFHSANHEPLGELLVGAHKRFLAQFDFHASVAVPLHPVRERERDFNQSSLLAQYLGQKVGLKHAPHLLKRIRNTRPQSRLSPLARLTNIAKAFAVPDPAAVAGRRLLLIDDVYTSGNTVNECARVLRQAGAASVHVLTVAGAP